MASENDASSEGLSAIERTRFMQYPRNVPESQAKAAALRDLGNSNSEVAETLGVAGDTASSYYSKFQQQVSQALRLALASFGGPKAIAGWQMVHNDETEKEWWYAVKPVREEDDIRDMKEFPPEGDWTLVKVRGDETTFSAESTRYESLDEMADDIYRNAEFDDLDTAQEVHGVLTESGIMQDELEDPRRKVNGV